MKIGDKVKIKDTGSTFDGKAGIIRGTMKPDYDWAVEVEGMSAYAEDSYGFAESELEVV